ncbi:5-formyltetrahydrofolate cyclo-ligase [Rhizosaccharibacter radicis]|uniref:5-formyltetrahydrofolate cyclo-ligase n=1 Tax=Rhizosaccharibacter radicis TaxID=2782605 RepID=A0ABT1VZS1_9PROT|nr:5-formyltetrahydrofolate cyclo-ligase [Acetobacteraceae bacterium KSS12]
MAAPHSFPDQPPSSGDIKRTLRREVRLRRERTASDAASLCEGIARLCGSLPSATVIGGIWPLPGEPDLRPAWTALHGAGHVVALPETTPRGEPLRFRRWDPRQPMLGGRFGTSHPDGPVLVPGLVFVPLLAFDDRCHRLGYGGGYYDRTLAALPGARAVGVGFEWQRVPRLPVEPFDVPLSAVLTEKRLIPGQGVGVEDLVSG